MPLTKDDLQQCLFAVIEQRAALHRGKLLCAAPRPDELIRKLFSELTELSPSRQSGDSDPQHLKHDWISAREAAVMLDWGLRRVQRRAAKFGARKIGGRLLFPVAAVREHIAGVLHE